MARGSSKPTSGLLPSLTRRSLLTGAGGVALSPAILKAAPRGSRDHVVVVGAGVFGAWTAHHLLAAGHRVTLVDAHGPAHSRASSGGESRMTRAAYGKDAIYARMAHDSLGQWKMLSAVSGLPIFHPTGVLFFAAGNEPYIADSIAVGRRLGFATEAMNRAQMARRFPMIDFTGIDLGVFEPGFGALMARRSVATLVERFVRAGGTYRHAAVMPPAPGKPTRALNLSTGEALAADRFVFAAGPWLGKLFPDLLANRIFATRQEVFFFAAPAGDQRFTAPAMPGWADFNGGDLYYGFPDLEGRGVKFARDTHGALVDPDTQSRHFSEEALAAVVAFRDRRFPALLGTPLTESRVCQYENSSNGDFLIDRHPVHANVVLVGGGSGHGFKHGPEVGRLAASLVSGSAPQSEPRFSLATKADTQKREVH
ncbi:MAG: FAD-dependent oxidoreductase [Pseudomonadota bacterium]|nr:FAD-dependent oxidoreductase [Pseudomonadota bacterium]